MSRVPQTGLKTLQHTKLAERRHTMGQPVVHFEIVGKDAEKLQGYYAELFGWEIDASTR